MGKEYKYYVEPSLKYIVNKNIKDCKRNKKKLERLKEDNGAPLTDSYLIRAGGRVKAIERVFERLDEQDRKEAELVFWSRYSREALEMEFGISKRAYYRIKDKVIYLVAQELDWI